MCPAVVMGVHAHAEPDRLTETVRSLQAQDQAGAAIVLLPDGPDAALAAALTADPVLAGLPRWESAEPLGAPACFKDAEIFSLSFFSRSAGAWAKIGPQHSSAPNANNRVMGLS